MKEYKKQAPAKAGRGMFEIVSTVLLLLFALGTVYPFYIIYVYAFNNGVDALNAPLYFWPRSFSLENIKMALEQPGIGKSFSVSALRTLFGTLLALLANSTLAYAMTKRSLPGHRFLMNFFFITFIFSGGMIPLYLTLRELHMLDTFWVLIIPGMYSYWNMIVFRSFYDGIPKSMEEAAEIDGASFLQTFFRAIVPVSKPVFAALGLFVAVGHWNDWYMGVFYITRSKLLPLQTLLQFMMVEADMLSKLPLLGGTNATRTVTPHAIRLSIVVITITPVILIYPFLQKYFSKGLMLGAVKE